MTPPNTLTLRKIRLEQADYEGIARLYREEALADGRDRYPSVGDIINDLTAPDFDLDNGIIAEQDGVLVGYSDAVVNPDGSAWAGCAVLPSAKGHGISHTLITTLDARLNDQARARFPDDRPLMVRRGVNNNNASGIALLQSMGYRYVRSFYDMHIALTDPPPTLPRLPEGVRVVPFDREAHGHALYEAHEEAFSEHWGFTPDTWEEYQHYVFNDENVDFSLWQIVWDGDEIAGYSVNRALQFGSFKMAWINQLGVRKAWRRRGLGTALLMHNFAHFRDRGFQNAGLGVDAHNTTNALQLYERAGMTIASARNVYEKRLR